MVKKVAILGGGQWGRTIGLLLAQKPLDIVIWDNRITLKDELPMFYEVMGVVGHSIVHEPYLETDLSQVLNNTELIIIALPSDAVRDVVKQVSIQDIQNCPVIAATKGFDEYKGEIRMMMEIVGEGLGKKTNIGILSGPNLSKEIQARHPAVTLIASKSKELIDIGMNLLASKLFRIYGSHDVIGVQVGGAVKNVIALAGGMVDELGFQYNTKAALLTRGLVEITRLGTKLGGERETFAGISGLGDLICTAFSPSSRNYRAGRMFAKGLKRERIEYEIGEVIEGINASRIVMKLAERENVEMPISDGVYKVVWDGIDPVKVIEELMMREMKFE